MKDVAEANKASNDSEVLRLRENLASQQVPHSLDEESHTPHKITEINDLVTKIIYLKTINEN